MKFVLILFFSGIYAVNSDVNSEYPFGGWHETVGIKNVANIKKYEDRYMSIQRIVGGAIAPVDAHPYLVGLLIDLWGNPAPSGCGGSLLTSSRILTAAHCWFDGRQQARRFTAVFGSPFLFHGGLRVFPNKIALHPLYDARTFANDIAILYTPVHIPFAHNIQPIKLPYGELLISNFVGEYATASGYGRYSDATSPTTNTITRYVSLEIMSLNQCRAFYGSAVLDSNICTSGFGGVGICQGDSGGPLTITRDGEPVLIGVSSFVARDGCELGFPSAFAKVSAYIDWIRWHM